MVRRDRATAISGATTSGGGGNQGGSGGGSGGGGGGGDQGGGDGQGTGGAPPTCDALYASAPGYVYCVEDPTFCEFNVDTAGTTSCSQACGGLGGTCLDAFDNGGSCELFSATDVACDFVGFGTTLCRCSRP